MHFVIFFAVWVGVSIALAVAFSAVMGLTGRRSGN